VLGKIHNPLTSTSDFSDDIREQYLNAEKRATIIQSEREQLAVELEATHRACKQGINLYELTHINKLF
jgi:hypothetical protein